MTEIIEFYNVILLHFKQSAAVSRNPRDIVYEECVDVLKSSKFGMSFEEIIKSACNRNEKVRRYIGDKFKLEHNIKPRPMVDLLQNHNHIVQISQKPIVFQWTDKKRDTYNNNILSDASDAYDSGLLGPDKNNSNEKVHENKNGSPGSISDTSYTSDRKQNQSRPSSADLTAKWKNSSEMINHSYENSLMSNYISIQIIIEIKPIVMYAKKYGGKDYRMKAAMNYGITTHSNK